MKFNETAVTSIRIEACTQCQYFYHPIPITTNMEQKIYKHKTHHHHQPPHILRQNFLEQSIALSKTERQVNVVIIIKNHHSTNII